MEEIIIFEKQRMMILYKTQKQKEFSILKSNNKSKSKLNLKSLKSTTPFSIFSFFFFFLATSVRTINSIRVSTGIFFGEKLGKFPLPIVCTGELGKFDNILNFLFLILHIFLNVISIIFCFSKIMISFISSCNVLSSTV